jgi:hypothetical protein
MPGSKKKTMDDVSDDDEDWYDTQADIDREANDDEDDASKLPNFESYDEFWAFTQEKNAQAVRDAGGDPAKTPGADNLPKGRHGETLKKGVPLSGKVRCWACDAVTTTQLECALCLEIMKEASRQGGVRQLGTRVLLLAPVLQRALPEPQGEARAVQVRPDQDGRDHPPVPVRRRVRRALGRKDAQTIQLRGVRAVRLNSAG